MEPSRVLRGALGRLEPYEAEVSRTVLRGRGWREPSLLPGRSDQRAQLFSFASRLGHPRRPFAVYVQWLLAV